jgi:hypothetical protein
VTSIQSKFHADLKAPQVTGMYTGCAAGPFCSLIEVTIPTTREVLSPRRNCQPIRSLFWPDNFGRATGDQGRFLVPIRACERPLPEQWNVDCSNFPFLYGFPRWYDIDLHQGSDI